MLLYPSRNSTFLLLSQILKSQIKHVFLIIIMCHWKYRLTSFFNKERSYKLVLDTRTKTNFFFGTWNFTSIEIRILQWGTRASLNIYTRRGQKVRRTVLENIENRRYKQNYSIVFNVISISCSTFLTTIVKLL